MEISRQLVSDIQERRFSRSRTLLMTGAIVGAVIVGTVIGSLAAGGEVGGGQDGEQVPQ